MEYHPSNPQLALKSPLAPLIMPLPLSPGLHGSMLRVSCPLGSRNCKHCFGLCVFFWENSYKSTALFSSSWVNPIELGVASQLKANKIDRVTFQNLSAIRLSYQKKWSRQWSPKEAVTEHLSIWASDLSCPFQGPSSFCYKFDVLVEIYQSTPGCHSSELSCVILQHRSMQLRSVLTWEISEEILRA